MIDDLIASASTELDLTSAQHLDELVSHAGEVFDRCSGDREAIEAIEAIEQELVDRGKDAIPLALHVACKLARSKAIVAGIESPLRVTTVFAVYKEHQRILPSDQHPHGEDFLNRKVEQLRWLFADAPHIDWQMIVVDDGCPEESGKIAEEIIAANQLGDRVRVRFLADAIESGHPIAAGLESTADSQKGGSILLGLSEAASDAVDSGTGHIVLYTDADLSTHLGQVGLLLDPLVNRGAAVAVGSRREPTSIVVKTGTRNTRGKLFIYLWKRLVDCLPQVIDTQCAFKGFRADLVPELVADNLEKKFAFDIELLIKAAQMHPDDTSALQTVALAWIDSEAASTTTDIEPYLNMLKSIAAMYRKYRQPSEGADSFASFIEALDQDGWDRLCDHVPPSIADREPFELGTSEVVSADDLKAIAGSTG